MSGMVEDALPDLSLRRPSPSARATNASGIWLRRGWGLGATAASTTAGCSTRTLSRPTVSYEHPLFGATVRTAPVAAFSETPGRVAPRCTGPAGPLHHLRARVHLGRDRCTRAGGSRDPSDEAFYAVRDPAR